MGSIYGSFFAKNNFDVLCYDVWDEHVDAINNKGLRVSGISGDHTEKKIRATTNFNELKDRDLYIIATKGDAVGSVASKLADFDLSSAIVLTIQNGLGAAERIEKFMPTENVILGVAQGFGASIKAPGHAHHNGMSMIRIGEINGGLTDRLTKIVNAWEKAGFTSKGFEDIQQLIWEKFICNVAYSGPCSVFKKTIGGILNVTGDTASVTFDGTGTDPVIKRNASGHLIFTDSQNGGAGKTLQQLAASAADATAFSTVGGGSPDNRNVTNSVRRLAIIGSGSVCLLYTSDAADE